MEFEWDEGKRARNLAKHGIDFRRAAQIFRSRVIEEVDKRRDYGETRITCHGEIAGRVYVVIYTWRGRKRRIISARKANEREIRAYHARHPRRGGGAAG